VTEVAPAASQDAQSGVDLVLEDLKLASPATLIACPAYTVSFRNQGNADASAFQVTIIAGLEGKQVKNGPRAKVEVKSLAAGEEKSVTLRLPQSALKLTGANGKLASFTDVIVSLDPNNSVSETDKTNNEAVVARAALETTNVVQSR
jgi:hypothetical protein